MKTSALGRKVTDFATSTHAGKAALWVKAPYDRAKARVATGLVRTGKQGTGPLVRRAKSAGATYRLWRLSRQADVDVNSLSDVERKRVSRFLARYGEDGADYLRRMDNDDIDALFGKPCGGVGTFGRVGGSECTELSSEEQDDFADAIVQSGENDVSGYLSDIKQKTSDKVSENDIRRFVGTNKPGAVGLTQRLDGDTLDQLLKLDADSRNLVVSAWRADRDATEGRLGTDKIDVMVEQGADVKTLGQRLDLSSDETRKLLRAYGSSAEVDEGPLNDANGLQSALDDLAEDDVEGVDDAIGAISGTDSGYKRIAGEADITDGLSDSDNGIGAADLQMERDVEANELPAEVLDSNDFKSGTDIDVKVDGELTVNGKTMDSPAIESKNWEFNSELPPDFRKDDIDDLKEKLSTYAASGEDEIIVVMPKKYIKGASDQLEQVEEDVSEVLDSLNTDADIPQEITIEFISYKELST